MRKIKLYLDTSILNFYYAKETPEYQKATRKLFQKIEKQYYRAYISEVVDKEIYEAPSHIKRKLKRLIKRYKLPSVKLGKDAEELADKYVSEKVIPAKYRDDAYHIAIASINNFDAIVSWNFSHIVKLKTKQMTKQINQRNNYKEIEIVTPQEVIPYGKTL